MTDRELVRLVTIDDVKPVENADALDVVTVGGWNVVSQKGLYKPLEEAWYFEVDSLLPIDNPAFEFLATRGIKEIDGKKYHRLKTIKLRGQISQGLLVPYTELNVPDKWEVNAQEYLGVLKFDDTVLSKNIGNGDTAGSFPTKYGQKTDAERVQNLKPFWDEIKADSWIATEKIDGCSLSVFRDEDANFRVCSRNWEVKDGDNLYWNTVRHYMHVFEMLMPGEGIQAEIYGPGIQGNRLDVKEVRIGIFNFLRNGVTIPRMQWPTHVYDYRVPSYHLTLPETIEDTIALADGIKSLINYNKLAEGIVWTNFFGNSPHYLGRNCFKIISNNYLLKEK